MMLKTVISSLSLLLLANLLWTQQELVAQLDFSSAKVSLAGPRRVYFRSDKYGSNIYSALLNYDGRGTAEVRSVYSATNKTFPDNVDLSATRLGLGGNDVLNISNITNRC